MIACFTGHRPGKLGGYDWDTPKNKAILKKLDELIYNEIKQNHVSTFIFGGALGIDQMAFYSAYMYNDKIKMILAIPFKDQPIKWFSEKDQNHYKWELEEANQIIYVDKEYGYETKFPFPVDKYHPAKMDLRNQWMVDHSHKVIAFWDGSKGGTCNCVKYAQKQEKEILIINPKIIG